MLNTTYLLDELRSEISRNDISSRPAGQSESDFIEQVLIRCFHIVQYGFPHLSLEEWKIKDKTAYKLPDLPCKIVLRRMNRNLRRVTGTRQSDRNTTIRRLSKLLREGVQHRVYKFDIQSFYESVDVADTWLFIDEHTQVDRKTSILLRSFIDLCRDNDVQGVPRGLSISATLAELTLRRFDEYVRNHQYTYFYARYVDDIVIVTGGHEDVSKFTAELTEQLPSGLKFHPIKSKPFELRSYVKNAPEDIKAIDFLGYEISVSQIKRASDQSLSRQVTLDISKNKSDRLKRRLVKIAIEYLHTNDIVDLTDRIRLLTGNNNIWSSRENRRVNIGLYCNYRLVDPEYSNNLRAVDKFYRAFILGYCGQVSGRFSASLSASQKKDLLRYSFLKSFEKRAFYHFSPGRVDALRRCWQYA